MLTESRSGPHRRRPTMFSEIATERLARRHDVNTPMFGYKSLIGIDQGYDFIRT